MFCDREERGADQTTGCQECNIILQGAISGFNAADLIGEKKVNAEASFKRIKCFTSTQAKRGDVPEQHKLFSEGRGRNNSTKSFKSF